MKFFYIANIRIPTEKAHGLQIMKMCEAFASLNLKSQSASWRTNLKNIEVELVVPWRFNPIKEDPFEYYGIEKNFKVTRLPCLDLIPLGLRKIGFLIQSFSFAKSVFFYVLFSALGGSAFGGKKADIIYSRDVLSLYFLSFYKKKLFWEVHANEYNFAVKRLLKKCARIVSISQGLKNFYVSKVADAAKIIVVPDAVDINEFDVKISKEEARKKLNLLGGRILTGYVGNLKTMGMEKGIDIAIESLKFLDSNVNLVLVGGRDEDIGFYRKMAEKLNLKDRVIFVGRVKHELIPEYLRALDVLIAPFPDIEHYRLYMSPLKIFEYMASGRPIVASNLPSLREILNKKNAVLIELNSAGDLAVGIKLVLQDADLAGRISKQAFNDVQNYTWQKRAAKIIGFMFQ